MEKVSPKEKSNLPYPFVNFEKVHNFRDTGLKRLYRGGHFDDATDEDKEQLKNLGIKVHVDLRTPEEVFLSKKLHGFQSAIARRIKFRDLLPVSVSKKSQVDAIVSRRPPVYEGEKETYNVNIFNLNYRHNAIWKRMNLRNKLKVSGYLLTLQKDKIEHYIGSNILAKNGLKGLLFDIVDFSGDSIKKALEIILKELEEEDSGIVNFHCSLSKDRTSVIAFFLNHIANVPLHIAAHDYSLSEQGLYMSKEKLIKQLLNDGLTTEFATSPIELYYALNEHIIAKFGSVDKYLDIIGFDASERSRLNKIISYDI